MLRLGAFTASKIAATGDSHSRPVIHPVKTHIAEWENPGYSDYNRADGQLSFRMMQGTVANRLNNNPAQFGAPGAQKLTDIIVAPNQFQGFTRVNGAVTLSQPVSSRIDAVMTNANTGGPGAYYQFVQDILDQVAAPVNDPLSGVTTINGTAVQGGTYGWRTAGSGDPPTTLSAGEFNASAGCTDTARHVKESFALLTFGIDRIMFSVDYPYAPNASGRAFLDRLSLAPADMAKLAHGNADALLKLKIRPAMSANSAP